MDSLPSRACNPDLLQDRLHLKILPRNWPVIRPIATTPRESLRFPGPFDNAWDYFAELAEGAVQRLIYDIKKQSEQSNDPVTSDYGSDKTLVDQDSDNISEPEEEDAQGNQHYAHLAPLILHKIVHTSPAFKDKSPFNTGFFP